MYVIFPATDVVEESYFSLVSQELETPTGGTNRTIPRARLEGQISWINQIPNNIPGGEAAAELPTAGPVFHDTTLEQLRAQDHISKAIFQLDFLEQDKGIDDIISRLSHTQVQAPKKASTAPSNPGNSISEVKAPYQGRVNHNIILKRPAVNYADFGLTFGEMTSSSLSSGLMTGTGVMSGNISAASGGGGTLRLCDITHPSLNEELKNQQQQTFRLVKTGKK